MVAVEFGPWMRCVSVLRAEYRSVVTVAVDSFSPLPTLNFVVSGLWFHSHCGPSALPVKVSVPIIGVTARGGVGTTGFGYEVPQAPLTVCTVGQPSADHVMGASAGTRPPG